MTPGWTGLAWSVEVSALHQVHWRIASIDRVGHGLGLVRREGEMRVGTRERRWGGGARCQVPCAVQVVWVFGRKVRRGTGVGSQEREVKSAATLGLPKLGTYLLPNCLGS